ncbi:hypothetical protein AVEN_236456-1 [Araneus ventricosus]|uniref:Uncharacterized protein n=1 Tax=Araneus ventricosus TaxID=182803 RepID=A0A4Y2IWK7_ARAVE|nr:hypothetical protein AVEN_236456-1 [Araneus ventricosus]
MVPSQQKTVITQRSKKYQSTIKVTPEKNGVQGLFSFQIKQDYGIHYPQRCTIKGNEPSRPFQGLHGRPLPSLDLSQRPCPDIDEDHKSLTPVPKPQIRKFAQRNWNIVPMCMLAVTQQRDSLVDINRFSSLKTPLKVTAWVFRFVNNVRNINKSMDLYFTADEI